MFALFAIATGVALGPVRPAITGISHIAVYASDPVKSERFYGHDLGGVKRDNRYYFAPTQFVEVLSEKKPSIAGRLGGASAASAPGAISRLDHVAFVTVDAEGLRLYLASKKISVPKGVTLDADGNRWFGVVDPEGNKIELWEPIDDGF